jgi:hypothetical protein
MSLVVTIQVTKSTDHLEQIHNVIITNVGLVEPMRGTETPYTATLDGRMHPEIVFHDRDKGALALLETVLGQFRKLSWYDND